jgi:DNA ligase-1
MTKPFSPMLLYRSNPDLKKLPYPVLASPKLDGVRGAIWGGVPHSRSSKPPPNVMLQRQLASPLLDGFDFELIVGAPNEGQRTFDRSSRLWKTHNSALPYTLYVFDDISHPEVPFERRYATASERIRALDAMGSLFPEQTVKLVRHSWITSAEQMMLFEERCVRQGFEGAVIRIPTGVYKVGGRTTLNEQIAFKLKRFVQSEAVVLDVIEARHNLNEAYINEAGYQKRSTHQDGFVGADRCGSLLVRDVHPNTEDHKFSMCEFNIGSGWSHSDGEQWWQNYLARKGSMVGRVLTYKYMPYGSKDAPRHPIFHGWRADCDLPADLLHKEIENVRSQAVLSVPSPAGHL